MGKNLAHLNVSTQPPAYYIRWLFLCFAGALFLSQSLMDIFSILLCLVWLYWALKKTMPWRQLFPPIGFDHLWLAWVFIITIGFGAGPGSLKSWALRVLEFKWIGIFYIITASLILIKPTLNWLKSIYIFFTCISIYSLSLFLMTHWEIGQYPHANRLGGPFDDPMTFAHSFGMFFCLLLSIYIQQIITTKRLNLLGTFCILLSGLTVLLTFTRGVWIGVFIAIIVSTFLLGRRYGFISLGMLCLLTMSLYFSWPRFKERVHFAFNAHENYDQQRITLWKANWMIFKDYPIFGAGYGENRKLLREYYDKMNVPRDFFESHAHNQFLHFLAGTGIIGLLCYLAVFYFFIHLGWKTFQQIPSEKPWARSLIIGTIAAQIEFLVSGFTEANFEHAKVRFVLMTIWAIIVWQAYETKVLGVHETSKA